MKIEIDVEQFAKDIKAGKSIGGANGALGSLIKQLTEAALAAEIDSHLAQDLNNNRRNGYSSKTMKSDHGTFELDVPRDRNGNFEPEIVKKNQTSMTSEIEDKILSLFALGNSYSQIAKHIEDFYCVGFSKATISAVTDKIIPMLNEWKTRPLEAVYPFVFLDAIHYKVKEDGKYISKAFYTVLGVRVDGKKEVLGLYLNESEGAKFWLQVLTFNASSVCLSLKSLFDLKTNSPLIAGSGNTNCAPPMLYNERNIKGCTASFTTFPCNLSAIRIKSPSKGV